MSEQEHCITCDTPTGKAGHADDSLYCDDCGAGPFCGICFDAHTCRYVSPWNENNEQLG